MSSDEQPRQSLRLRKMGDRAPDAPPSAPPQAPPAASPAPSDPGPAQQLAPKEAIEAPKIERPRLTHIIKADTSPTAPETPPPSDSPAPKAAETPPPPSEPTAPAPEIAPVATQPEPAPTATPSESQAAPPPSTGAPVFTSMDPPRPLHFPPPDPKPADPQPKPPSARTVGIVGVGGLLVVAAAVAYFFFMDPFGLFSEPEPVAVAEPVQTPPPAPPSVVSTTTPAAATPTPQSTPTPTQPSVAEPDIKMPALVPLSAGEEIAPGVVRLPRDAAPISIPAPRSYEPSAPKQNPAYTAIINNLNITGIRENTSGGFLMIGGAVFKSGDIIDAQNKIEFVSAAGGLISFKDPAGAVYTRRF